MLILTWGVHDGNLVTVNLISIFKGTQAHSTLRETVKDGWFRLSDELVWNMGFVVPSLQSGFIKCAGVGGEDKLPPAGRF